MSSIKYLEIPKWGLSMEEGTITEWFVSEGERFSEGQELVEIETSKISNLLEAPFSGVLRRILAKPGDTLSVQAPIAICAELEVSDEELDSFIAKSFEGATSGSSVSDEEVQSATMEESSEKNEPPQPKVVSALEDPTPIVAEFKNAEVSVTPRALQLAIENSVDLTKISGSGRNDRISVEDIRKAIPRLAELATNSKQPRALSQGKMVITPAADRLAKLKGLDIALCEPKDPSGRITTSDVEAAIVARDQPQQSLSLSGMRKTIGLRLQASKREAPHFRIQVDCRVNDLMAMREKINHEFPSVKVSLNDLIVKACASALVQNPVINSQFDGQSITRFSSVDISIAVAIEDGLITPIIKNASQKGLKQISAESRLLIDKAKTGNLAAEEFQGGSFTISNLGMFGITRFDAIINPPQVSILAVGGIEKRLVMTNSSSVSEAPFMCLTLSSDHRVVDGTDAAKFMADLKRIIENPALLVA
jgi:pyruvate dehydrogenase E2 component (dihydrolipoamide acetyltransferase)